MSRTQESGRSSAPVRPRFSLPVTKGETHSIELKVCGECQSKHSTTLQDLSQDASRRYSVSQNNTNPHSARLLRQSTQNDASGTNLLGTGELNPAQEGLLYNTRNLQGELNTQEDEQLLSTQEIIDHRHTFQKDGDEPEKDEQGSIERMPWNRNLNKDEGTFGYYHSGGLNQGKNKYFMEESPIRRNDCSTSQSDFVGKDMSALGRVNTDKSLVNQKSTELSKNKTLERDDMHRSDNDNSGNIQTNKENQQQYQNRHYPSTNDIYEGENLIPSDEPYHSQKLKQDKSGMSDMNYDPSNYQNTGGSNYFSGQQQQYRSASFNANTNQYVYVEEEQDQSHSYDMPFKKTASLGFEQSAERKQMKGFRDIKRHLNSSNSKGTPSAKFQSIHTSKDSEELIRQGTLIQTDQSPNKHFGGYQSGHFNQQHQYASNSTNKVQDEVEGYLNASKDGVSVKKLNEKLKGKTGNPNSALKKKDRFLLSPPKSGNSTAKRYSIQQKSSNRQLEYSEADPRSTEYYENYVEETTERAPERVSFAYLDDLNTDEKIKSLQDAAISAIKNGYMDQALQRLLKCESIIKSELSLNDPQRLYIDYLLGECFLKMEEFDQAESILERAQQAYESRRYTAENKHVYTYYYLGILLLLGHLYMARRSYEKCIEVYGKLVLGVEKYGSHMNNSKKIMKTIPHILLIKYNLGESFRNLEEYTHTDNIFSEILFQFDLKNDELLENYTVLLSIAEYFISRKLMDLALKALIKISEVARHTNIQEQDPELFVLIYDEIGSIFYNNEDYKNACEYYELSLRIKNKLYGIKSQKVGFSMLALGKSYYMCNQYTFSLQRLGAGLEIIENLEGRNNAYSGSTCILMAKMKYSLKDYGKALALYERSLDIYAMMFGMNHAYCLRIYINIIHLCFEMANMQKLGHFMSRLMGSIDQSTDCECFAILNEIGNIYRKHECPDQAAYIYQKALEKYEEINKYEVSSEMLNLVKCNLASSLSHTKKLGEALQYYMQAGGYFDKLDGGLNKHAALIAIGLARIYKILHKNSDASVYIKKANKIIQRIDGREDCSALKRDLKVLSK